MSVRIQLRRGTDTNIPTTGLLAGEALWTSDRGNLHVAVDATTSLPVTPPIDKLTTVATLVGTDDLLMVHDASATGQKEKKITFNAFKTALNIPAASTDELVAITDGGTAGYIWGTTGTDGIIRMGTSLTWTKDVGNGFVTLKVADGGIDTLQIAASAVTEAKIGTGAVTAAKIGSNAVTTIKINNLAVTTDKIAANAVTRAKVETGLLDLSTQFTGNGISSQLSVTSIDGGAF